jgi:putative transposase
MPNHWHLVLRPRTDTALSRFKAWLTLTHVRRHHGHYPSVSGHLYQGRCKSFPVETDEYFLALCRYVEANPLRAKLVYQAEKWRWSSLQPAKPFLRPPDEFPLVAPWPDDRPTNWKRVVNEPLAESDRERIESSVQRDSPLGSDRWSKQLATKLKLRQTLNALGRPRKPESALSKRQQQRRAKEGRQIGA